jgi:hypothetical protein
VEFDPIVVWVGFSDKALKEGDSSKKKKLTE